MKEFVNLLLNSFNIWQAWCLLSLLTFLITTLVTRHISGDELNGYSGKDWIICLISVVLFPIGLIWMSYVFFVGTGLVITTMNILKFFSMNVGEAKNMLLKNVKYLRIKK